MSNKISKSVKYMQLPNVAKQVLTGLADFADDSGRAYPSITTLSYALCLTTRSVSNGLAKLRELGLITQTTGNGGNNIYIIHPENFKGEFKYPPSFKASPLNDVLPCNTLTPERDSTTIEPHSCDPRTSFIEPLNDVLTNHHITIIEPSGNHQSIPAQAEPQKTEPAEKPAAHQKLKLSVMPQDFGISERVSKWANEKGYTHLETHLEYFIGYVQASGKKYADWDAALMQAIRGNWAKVNTKPMAQYQVTTNVNAPEDNHVPVMTDYERDENGMPVFTPIDWSDVLAEVDGGRAS